MNIVYPPPKVQPLPGEMLAGLGRVKTGPRMVPMTAEVLGAAPGEESEESSIPWGWILAAVISTVVLMSLGTKRERVADAEPL